MKTILFYILLSGMAVFLSLKSDNKPVISFFENVLTVNVKDTVYLYKNGNLIFRQWVEIPPLNILIRTGNGNYTAKIDTVKYDFTIE